MEALSSENSIYDFQWLDKDKELYVLQNRVFKKEGRLYIGGGLTTDLIQPFINTKGFILNAGFFITENWGFSVSYGSFSNNININFEGVANVGTAPFYQGIASFQSGSILWSPFYAKINTFNSIIYFDLIFGIGFAKITTQDNRNSLGTGDLNPTLVEESFTGGIGTIMLKTYLSKHFSITTSFRGIAYKGDVYAGSGEPSRELTMNYFINLGMDLTF